MAKKKRAGMVARMAGGEDEVEQRRKEREREAKARAAERKSAWKEHEAARKDAEQRRKASEPDKEFAEAARRARERAEKERIDLHRKGYDAEARRRGPDEKMEKRFREKHPDVLKRHLLAWATLQEISQGADVNATREALQVMARAWKEKEDLIHALAASRKRKKGKGEESTLEARTESLKERLAELEESRRKNTPKPSKKKKAPPKKKNKLLDVPDEFDTTADDTAPDEEEDE